MIIFILVKRGLGSFDMLGQSKHRDEHADENGADDGGHEEKNHWFSDGNGGFELAIQIAFRDAGDADQFLVQPAALFGDGNHFNDGAAEKTAAFRETFSKLAAFLDAVNRL